MSLLTIQPRGSAAPPHPRGASIRLVLVFALSLSAAFSASAALVNYLERAVNDADGATIGALASDQWLAQDADYTSANASAAWSSYRFTHWTHSGHPATVTRDAWGRALNPFRFHLLAASSATAHYLPTTRDSDGDGVPDWFEIEYYGTLEHGAASDTDGDGVTLLAEYTAGTNPLFANAAQPGGVAWTDSALITCNLAGYATYVLRSVPAGTVNQSAVVPPGTAVTVPNQPGGATFGYWTLDGVRQQDAWGVALTQFSFTVESTDREAVAYLFSGDSDSDGVPDAFEQRHYGTLAHGATSDTDGDGVTLLAEYTAGTNPLFANAAQPGGVAWTDSALITCNLAGYATYVLRSVPAGTVNQSAVVPPGTAVTVPNQPGGATFGYWTLDGVRQQDAWGVALTQFSFTVENTDREAVAYLFSGDSDSDGVPDAFEQRHYGTLAHGATSDTDGDGVTLLAEYTAGTNPHFGNAAQPGGVAWTDSALLTANLQAEIAIEQPAGNEVPDGGQCDFGGVLVAATAERAFTIRNHGGGPLTGLGLTLEGADAAAFSIVAAPVAPVPHHGSTTFTVRFAPDAVGPKSALLRVASNDADEASYDITLTGTGLNNPPHLDVAAEVTVARNTTHLLQVGIGDVETPAGELSVTAISSDETLLPAANLVLAGVGTGRMLQLTPQPDLTGSATIIVTVCDGELSTSAVVQFLVIAYPPLVVTGEVGEITTTAATLHGSVNARGFASTVQFAYGLTSDCDRVIAADPAAVTAAGVTPVSVRLEGLAPATTYHYRLVATSNQGAGEGVIGSFTTLGVAPFIVVAPQSQTATAGDAVTFSVEAGGVPAPTYQWQKNGAELPGATASSLALTDVRLGDAGDYTVTITNSVGTVTSAPAVLTVEKRAQTIAFAALPPVTPLTAPFALVATADSGLPVAFTSSNPAVATVEGNIVTIAGLGTAVITARQEGDDYWQAAADVTRELVSGTTLTVVLLEDAFAGAAGTSPDEARYVWSGQVVHNGAGELSLHTQTVQHSWLRSKAAAAPGADDVLHLRLRACAYAEHWNPGVYGDRQPRGLRVGNDPANVVEFYSASRTSVGLRTRRDGVETAQVVAFPAGVDSLHDYEITVTPAAATFAIDGTVVGVLTTNLPVGPLGLHVSTDDGGGVGNVPASLDEVRLTLRTELSSPVIIAGPAVATVEHGDAVSFTVVATGTAPLGYVWRKDGEIIPGAQAAIFTLAAADWVDAGDYTVQVTNPIGTASASAARLTVTRRAQQIVFAALAERLYTREPIALSAQSSSGLPVTFTVLSGPAAVVDGALRLTGPGEVVVQATQDGDALYAAATPVGRSLWVLASYQAWQDEHFTAGQCADASVSGPAAKPAGDGCPNLVKYALDLDPWQPAHALGEVVLGDGFWRFIYRRPVDRADLLYAVEVSRDLNEWTVADVVHERIAEEGGVDVWQARVPADGGAVVFFRLKITAP